MHMAHTRSPASPRHGVPVASALPQYGSSSVRLEDSPGAENGNTNTLAARRVPFLDIGLSLSSGWFCILSLAGLNSSEGRDAVIPMFGGFGVQALFYAFWEQVGWDGLMERNSNIPQGPRNVRVPLMYLVAPDIPGGP